MGCTLSCSVVRTPSLASAPTRRSAAVVCVKSITQYEGDRQKLPHQ